MSNANKRPVSVKIDLVEIGEFFRTSVPANLLPTYEAYLSHLRKGDFVSAQKLADLTIDPQLWVDSTPSTYRAVRQAFSLGEKVSMKGDQLAEEAAWRKFLSVEQKCRRTNRRLRFFRLFPDRAYSSPVFRSARTKRNYVPFIHEQIRKIVADIFGPLEMFYPSICQSVCYGKGTDLSSRDPNRVSIPFKLSNQVTITRAARPVWRDFLVPALSGVEPPVDWVTSSDGILRAVERVKEVPGCRITFVDKTSVIKRTIAIEPSANISMQLAIHRHLHRRLLRVGIDITDQTKNRSAAREGSITGDLATIDLSSASDLISIELVRRLLPSNWFDLLNSLRSPVGTYRDKVMTFEKFSSMGNGFTFALETVLFYAIAKAACMVEGFERFNPLVYGDDIIVPSLAYNTTESFLKWHGFKVNTKKSYYTGPFRESCGFDAFKGVDVRPVFIRNTQFSVVELIDLHNRCFSAFGGDSEICKYLSEKLPKHYRLFGPEGPEAGFLFTRNRRTLVDFGRWDNNKQTYCFEAVREDGFRTKKSLADTWLLESSLYDGGRYSRGAPLRFRTKLVRYKVYREITHSLGTTLG